MSRLYTTVYIWRWKSRQKAIKEDKEEFDIMAHLKVSLPMTITSFALLLNGKLDMLMLGMYDHIDTEILGIFSAAFKISILTNFVFAALKTIAMPKISELFWSGQTQRLERMVSKSALLIFSFTGPVSIILIVFSEDLLGLFGEGYSSGTGTLRIFAITQMINSACGLVAAFLNMTGDEQYFTRLILISTLMNLVLNALLIPILGMEGAAWATLLSTAFWNILGTRRVYVKHGIATFLDPRVYLRSKP